MLKTPGVLLTNLVVLLALATASPKDAGQTTVIAPEEDGACSALASQDFSGIPDAPTQITEAQLIAAGGDFPAYCQVQGYISPQVGFELRLPASNWNGKFMEVGCGGWCGSINASAGDSSTRLQSRPGTAGVQSRPSTRLSHPYSGRCGRAVICRIRDIERRTDLNRRIPSWS